MDLEKRKLIINVVRWMDKRDMLTDKWQLIPYEIAEMYLEQCEGKETTNEKSNCIKPAVSNNEVTVCPKCGYDEIFSFHGSNTCLNKECDWAN